MGLKILHSADWHLDSPFAGFSPEARALLRQAQRELPEKIGELCRRKGCDLVLLAGDIFDGPASPETLELLGETFARMEVPVLIAPGNHDYLGKGSPWEQGLWPENVHIFKDQLSSVVFPQLDCRVWGAGYRSMDCPPLLEGFRAAGGEIYQLGVIHADPVQLRSPYCPVTAAQVRDSGLAYLALGHIHKAGSFRAGQSLCGWPGAPMGRGWDETGEKGIYLVSLDETPSLEFLPLNTPRFYDLETEVTTTAEEAIRGLLPAVGNPDFYRVTLTGQREPLALPVFLDFPNLELRDRTVPPVPLWDACGQDSLEGIYFQMLRDALETEEEATVYLAAEISRRILDGREVTLP